MSWREAFEAQARSCEALGSPFTARLMRLLPGAVTEGPILARLQGWSEEASFRAAAVPLRLAGGLHALVRAGDPLAGAYPPHEATNDALGAALRDALSREERALLAALDGPPQTNEVRRSAAIIPAAHLLAARHGLPLVVSEVGASAGLNLLFDRFALDIPPGRLGPSAPALTLRPEWTGPLPAPADVRVAARAGCDLAPVDVRDPGQRERLLCYLWPDQPERVEMTRAAIAAGPPLPERAGAADWLERRLAEPRAGAVHLVVHTVMWQYLSAEEAARAEAALGAAGARATGDAPLARLAVEHDGGRGAAATLTTWPGGATELLGRVCFHGRWADWRVAA